MFSELSIRLMDSSENIRCSVVVCEMHLILVCISVRVKCIFVYEKVCYIHLCASVARRCQFAASPQPQSLSINSAVP